MTQTLAELKTQAEEHAKVSAVFFQALLIEGVGATDACSMTSSYISNLLIFSRHQPQPETPA